MIQTSHANIPFYKTTAKKPFYKTIRKKQLMQTSTVEAVAAKKQLRALQQRKTGCNR